MKSRLELTRTYESKVDLYSALISFSTEQRASKKKRIASAEMFILLLERYVTSGIAYRKRGESLAGLITMNWLLVAKRIH